MDVSSEMTLRLFSDGEKNALVRAVAPDAAAHRMAVPAMPDQRLPGLGFEKFRDEHRRHIAQAILALRVGKVITVAARAQLIRDLVNDECRVRLRCEHRVSVIEDLALFRLFEDAERNARDDIVAVRQTFFRQHIGELHAVLIVDADAQIVRELPAEMFAKFRINFKEQQVGIRMHPLRDLARVAAFAGTEFRDNTRSAVIHFVGHFADERLGTRHNRGHPPGASEESFQEKCAHVGSGRGKLARTLLLERCMASVLQRNGDSPFHRRSAFENARDRKSCHARGHVLFSASQIANAAVAQLDRASDYESEGLRFDSSRLHHLETQGFQGDIGCEKSGAFRGTSSNERAKDFPNLRKAPREQERRVSRGCGHH